MAEPPDAPPASWKLPRLRVDASGDWYDDDVQITHLGILQNLRSTLQRDTAGYFIQTRVRIPVEVEDTPFVVTRVERRGDALHAVLNDGDTLVIDPSTLRVGPGDIPYCAVKTGAFEARFARAAAFQLLDLAAYDERTGRGVLRVGDRDYVLTSGERAS